MAYFEKYTLRSTLMVDGLSVKSQCFPTSRVKTLVPKNRLGAQQGYNVN
jgi:hypothetical protein